MAAEQRYVTFLGLDVVDPERYQQYRAGMTPILHRYGGGFGYDLTVRELLKSEADQPFNRVFSIYFPSAEVSERFFADPDYLRVRQALFDGAVRAINVLATFVEPVPARAG
ncbi:MAG TPA: DUF1330 domain-containing protein [Polyangiales bacterium]